MDAVTFLVRYPEFSTANPEQVISALTDADLSIDRGIYGAKGDVAQGALAAHLLWTGVAGNSLRLSPDGDPKNASTTSLYWAAFLRIRREVTVPWAVL